MQPPRPQAGRGFIGSPFWNKEHQERRLGSLDHIGEEAGTPQLLQAPPSPQLGSGLLALQGNYNMDLIMLLLVTA